MIEFVEYPDRDLMMLDVADKLAAELSEHLLHEERVSFCVPGGTTPGPVFDVLSAQHLDWGRVSVFLSDERWVPESSDRSNTRLLKERLLVSQAAAATFVPLVSEAATPEEGIAQLSDGLAQHLPITVLLLGMGADMHTASLFPGADKLAEAMDPHAPLLMPMRAAGAPEPRVTLTAPVLSAAISTHILIAGAEKREALERAQHLTPDAAPVRAVLPGATVHWAP